MIKPDLSLPIPETITSVHFVGIGGSGMSGLARMFLAAGHTVSGSDRSDSPALRELAALGATVHVGHDAAHLGGAPKLRATVRLVIGGALALIATYVIGMLLGTAGVA